MITPDFSTLELRESTTLPRKTLIAPLSVVREIRLMLGPLDLDVRIGMGETVLISSDLFAAFTMWQAEWTEVEGDDDDDANLDAAPWN